MRAQPKARECGWLCAPRQQVVGQDAAFDSFQKIGVMGNNNALGPKLPDGGDLENAAAHRL
jgi:hypothetical protein